MGLEILLGIAILIGAFVWGKAASDTAVAAVSTAPPGDPGCLILGTLWIALPTVVFLFIVLALAGQI